MAIACLCLDRCDIGFATKETMRRLSSPTRGDEIALKRLVRYLMGADLVSWKVPLSVIKRSQMISSVIKGSYQALLADINKRYYMLLSLRAN